MFGDIPIAERTISDFILVSVSPDFTVALICLFFVGIFMVTVGVASQSLMQNAVDPNKRGRVIGLSTGMAIGLPAIGSLCLGSLGSLFGIQAPVAGAMVLSLICLAWAAPRVLRQSDKLEKACDSADTTNA